MPHFTLSQFDLDAFDEAALPVIEHPTLSAQLPSPLKALPLFQDGSVLWLAISDFAQVHTLENFKYYTPLTIEVVLVQREKLSALLEKCKTKAHQKSLKTLANEDLAKLLVATSSSPLALHTEHSNAASLSEDAEEAPLVHFLNQLLSNAIEQGASDLHFEPFDTFYRVRSRQDGILYETLRLSPKLAPRIHARLKVMAKLDIAEQRLPQDGRFKFMLPNKTLIDFRINSCPTLFGEKIVLRLQDPRSNEHNMDRLGYEPWQKQVFIRHLQNPQGMILVTGPTGSGKTLSLYSAIHFLNSIERNISTCEDPIEIYLAGVNQINVNHKIGLSFATILRAFLRQDPDVLMIGEIRDLDTAEIAVQAAQTGHLVLSTLHTNSAADAINRLSNMGIPSYLLASSLSLIIAQRLARTLCERCKIPHTLSQAALAEVGFSESELSELQALQSSTAWSLYQAVGCDHCKQGYKGRTGIYEVLPISVALQEMIVQGMSTVQLHQYALTQGMWDLKKSALEKLKNGMISVAEMNRVIRYYEA